MDPQRCTLYFLRGERYRKKDHNYRYPDQQNNPNGTCFTKERTKQQQQKTTKVNTYQKWEE